MTSAGKNDSNIDLTNVIAVVAGEGPSARRFMAHEAVVCGMLTYYRVKSTSEGVCVHLGRWPK